MLQGKKKVRTCSLDWLALCRGLAADALGGRIANQGTIRGVGAAVDVQDALADGLASRWDIRGAVLRGVARRRAKVSGEASHGDVHLIGHASGCWVTIVGGVGLESNEAGLEGSGDSDGRESKSELQKVGEIVDGIGGGGKDVRMM